MLYTLTKQQIKFLARVAILQETGMYIHGYGGAVREILEDGFYGSADKKMLMSIRNEYINWLKQTQNMNIESS